MFKKFAHFLDEVFDMDQYVGQCGHADLPSVISPCSLNLPFSSPLQPYFVPKIYLNLNIPIIICVVEVLN